MLDSTLATSCSKNRVPIAYGGGWPFLGTCKIGISIFAPFRGGESAFLMVSVLRVYAQLFAVERFVVEPYQFGAGNREGLESGAFWFYFRLGFRPVEPKLHAVALDEFEQMRRKPGYRDVAVRASALHALRSRSGLWSRERGPRAIQER